VVKLPGVDAGEDDRRPWSKGRAVTQREVECRPHHGYHGVDRRVRILGAEMVAKAPLVIGEIEAREVHVLAIQQEHTGRFRRERASEAPVERGKPRKLSSLVVE